MRYWQPAIKPRHNFAELSADNGNEQIRPRRRQQARRVKTEHQHPPEKFS